MITLQAMIINDSELQSEEILPGHVLVANRGEQSLMFINGHSQNLLLNLNLDSITKLIDYLLVEFGPVYDPTKQLKKLLIEKEEELEKYRKRVEVLEECFKVIDTMEEEEE